MAARKKPVSEEVARIEARFLGRDRSYLLAHILDMEKDLAHMKNIARADREALEQSYNSAEAGVKEAEEFCKDATTIRHIIDGAEMAASMAGRQLSSGAGNIQLLCQRLDRRSTNIIAHLCTVKRNARERTR